MSKRSKSFSYRLSMDFVFITSLLFLASMITAAIASYKIIEEEATRSAMNMLGSAMKEIEIETQKVEDMVNAMSWLVEEHLDDPEYMYHITSRLTSESPTVYGSAIAFVPDFFEGKYWYSPYTYENQEKGGELCSIQLGNENYDYFNMEWFRKALDTGESCWSEPYIDTGGGEMEMSTYSKPIKDSEGNIKAVLTADFYLKTASEIIERVKPYPNSRAVLASQTGQYIVSKDKPGFGQNILSSCKAIEDKNALRAAEEMIAGKSGFTYYNRDGKISLLGYGSLNNGWKAALISDCKEVLKNSKRMQLILLLEAVLGLLVLFFLCRDISKKLTRPLTDFESAAKDIAKGNFSTLLPEIDSDDEIRHLRDSFDYMRNSLNNYIKELKEKTAHEERIESELAIANHIQMGILPQTFPQTDRIRTHAMLKPAKEVGGDFFDFIRKDEKTLFFTVGDVSGKGVPAALVMAMTISSFRSLANPDLTLSQFVGRMNDSLCDSNEEDMFVTMFVGKIDLENGKITYCNAGHNPIVVCTPDGKAELLKEKPNLAIGMIKGFEYEEQELTLERGSRIIVYTDGVTEAEQESKDQYGNERLLECAGRIPSGTDPQTACGTLYEDVSAFTGDNIQNDDITIMTISIDK